MTKTGCILFFNLLFIPCITSNAQDIFAGFEHLFTPVRNYTVYRTVSDINIDGKSLEKSWVLAKWTEVFQDIEGDLKPAPEHQTRVKMLWDNHNLYILVELEEPHVWSYIQKHDAVIYHENDFEVFIDPDGDSRNYFEIEINAQNTIFDLFMPKPYRNGGPPLISWNVEGIKTAVFIDGTLNNPTDVDKKWVVEMAIPFESLRLGLGNVMPYDGKIWRINFSRVQWQTEIKDGKYVRKKDLETGKLIPENNWVWSPIGIINMHYPERWGIIQFSDSNVGKENDNFQPNAKMEFQKYLWLIYYKQAKYHTENGKYAKQLSQIDMPLSVSTNNGRLHFELISSELQYTAILTTTENVKMTVNQDGFIR